MSRLLILGDGDEKNETFSEESNIYTPLAERFLKELSRVMVHPRVTVIHDVKESLDAISFKRGIAYIDTRRTVQTQLTNLLELAGNRINVVDLNSVMHHELFLLSRGQLHAAPSVMHLNSLTRVSEAYTIKFGYKLGGRDVITVDDDEAYIETPQIRGVKTFSATDVEDVAATNTFIVPDEQELRREFERIISIDIDLVRSIPFSTLPYPAISDAEAPFYIRTLDVMTLRIYGELLDEEKEIVYDPISRYFHQTLVPMPKTRYVEYPLVWNTQASSIRLATHAYRTILSTGRDGIKYFHLMGLKHLYPSVKKHEAFTGELDGRVFDVSGHLFNMLIVAHAGLANIHLYLRHVRTNVIHSLTKKRVPVRILESVALDELNGYYMSLWHNYDEFMAAVHGFVEFSKSVGLQVKVSLLKDVIDSLGDILSDYPAFKDAINISVQSNSTMKLRTKRK
jgi:hypothetical protein